ncbi:iron ABC transporter substrate-binding protein [Ignatzschineria cameli]|uniref:iron ABC transporter substrate-binding protein n=1 Tax=Ignatzschineria cameli TaxID=2182793 RepID=UPI000D608E70|nr:iron ABC transporter substrate-binding protein [Ignatzschineria cameli]PWD85376.1 hypothetical protein DC080_06880 [Ignatzschineria cameli]
MIRRRTFLKSIIAGAILIHYPALAQEKTRSFLIESFGILPAPQNIERILSAGPVSDILLLSLAPHKLLGLAALNLTPAQRAFFPKEIGNLPMTGRFAGRGTTASLEKIVALKPDLILDVGNITPTYLSTAERVYEQTQLPYLLANGSFADTAKQLRTLGEILGVTERGEALAQFAEKILKETQDLVPHHYSKPISIYSARSADGLETGLAGSIHTEVIDWLGAKNSAAPGGEKIMTRISMEQLLAWQPDLIITMDENFYHSLPNNRLWQRLNAIKKDRVYLAPKLPFGWLDQPPSINRLLGAIWLAHLLVPEVMPTTRYRDLIAEYYALFYQQSLSTDQLNQLLEQDPL